MDQYNWTLFLVYMLSVICLIFYKKKWHLIWGEYEENIIKKENAFQVVSSAAVQLSNYLISDLVNNRCNYAHKYLF